MTTFEAYNVYMYIVRTRTHTADFNIYLYICIYVYYIYTKRKYNKLRFVVVTSYIYIAHYIST